MNTWRHGRRNMTCPSQLEELAVQTYNAVASLKVIVNLKMNILSFLLIYFYRKRNSSPKNKNSAKMLTYVYQWNN